MNPPVSYYGGKQRIALEIIQHIPMHTVYCEPFCGGAAVMFKKPHPKVTNNSLYREIINDTDGHLINFYKQLRDNGDELVRRLMLTPYSEQEHKDAKRLDVEDDIERARKYYVNISQSFSNVLNRSWSRNTYGMNHAKTWVNKTTKLGDFIDRMSGVHISCCDAIKCIKDWDSPQTFFYIDPPYPGADQGHYSGYTVEDFNDLIDTLKTAKGSFILSCYQQENMPDEWECVEIKANMSAARCSNKKINKRTELIWIKQASEKPRQEIQKLYASGKYNCFKKHKLSSRYFKAKKVKSTD